LGGKIFTNESGSGGGGGFGCPAGRDSHSFLCQKQASTEAPLCVFQRRLHFLFSLAATATAAVSASAAAECAADRAAGRHSPVGGLSITSGLDTNLCHH